MTKMVTDSGPGMKVLLMDKETVSDQTNISTILEMGQARRITAYII